MILKLNKKNEEVFCMIPKEYRSVILNTILTKSFENGSLIKELNFYMSNSELEEVLKSIEIPDIEIKKRSQYYSKNKQKQNIKREIESTRQKEEKSNSIFSGFDND